MKSPLNVASLSPVAAVGRAQGTAATETDGSSSSMDLLSDDFVTFAQRITLHDGFTMRDVSATVANLRAYEPTLFALAAAASAGGALPELVRLKADGFGEVAPRLGCGWRVAMSLEHPSLWEITHPPPGGARAPFMLDIPPRWAAEPPDVLPTS